MLIKPMTFKARASLSRVVDDDFADPFRDVGRENRDRVARMDAGPLKMLHDARDQDVFAVRYRIDLEFDAHQVFVDQDRMLLFDQVDDPHVFDHFVVAVDDGHALPAQDVGRSDQHRITQFGCGLQGFLGGHDSRAARTLDLAFFKNCIETLAVFGRVDHHRPRCRRSAVPCPKPP